MLFPAVHGNAGEIRNGAKDVIIVGGNSAYPPYEFLDGENKPTGFVVELTRAIAETMGFEVEIKLGKSWAEMREELEAGKIDVLEGISFSENREKILDFSPPHSFISHSIFTRKGVQPVSSLDELRGKEVIILGRGVMHDYFEEEGQLVHPIPASTVADALILLSSGKYDYAVLATLPASYLIKDMAITNVEMVAKSIDTKKYCYAVRVGNQAILAKFNEGLALLKETGRYRELQEKWLGGVDTTYVPWTWLAKYSLFIVGLLILGLLVSIIWSRMLTMQVAVRTAALEHEIEERKRSARELGRQQQQLIQADKMAALGVLVSGVAHEINNPNGLVLLNLPLINEVMRDISPILDAYYREHGDFPMGGLAYSRMRHEVPHLLDEMQDAAKRIKRIVDDLKHFSRKSDADSKEMVNVNDVVRTSLRLAEHSLRRSAIRCNVHYTEPLPQINGNAQRLEQVIVNLILNAAQAIEASSRAKPAVALESPADGRKSSPDNPHTDKGIFVVTAYDHEAGTVAVKVHDDGIGIPPEHLPRLTDPFFTTKRDTGGTGLGLAISAQIIREHGGTISFESLPHMGATVVVTLPVAAVEVHT